MTKNPNPFAGFKLSEQTPVGRRGLDQQLFTSQPPASPEQDERPAVQTVRQPDSQTAKPQRIKATFYLTPDDILAIDALQGEEFKRTGKKPERSHIVSRAIQALRQQQDSQTAEDSAS